MILLTHSSRSTAAPTHARRPASQGALARGDRSLVVSQCVQASVRMDNNPQVCGPALVDDGATSAQRSVVTLLPSPGVLPLGIPAPASRSRGVGAVITSVMDKSNPLVKDLPCRSTHRVERSDDGDLYPPVAVVSTLTVVPRVAFIDANKDRKGFPAMAQTMGQHYELAEEAAAIERCEIEDSTSPDSPGGVLVTEHEFAKIQRARRHRMRAEKSAMSVYLGQKIAKNGYDAPSVIREIKDLYPNFDDAA